MIKIVVADDHMPIRAYMAHFAEQSGFQLLEMARSGEEAIALYRKLNPDVIVLDIDMPKQGGLLASRDILRFDPHAKVVVFSGALQNTNIAVLKELGVLGFVKKGGEEVDDLKQAIECAHRGEIFYCAESTKNMKELEEGNDVFSPLSRNEKIVALSLACEMSLRNIAKSMHIEESTVRTHKQHVFKKLHIHSLDELYLLARRYGIFQTHLRAA